MDRLICGDVGFGKTEVAHPRGLRRGDVGGAGGGGRADDAAGAAALQDLRRAVPRACRIEVRPLSRFVVGQGGRARRARGWPKGTVDIVVGHPRGAGQAGEVREPRAAGHRRGAAFRGGAQGAAEGAALGHPRPDADRDADPAHAADGAVGGAGAVGDRDAADRPAGDPHLRQRVRHDDRARGAAARALPRRAGVLRRAAHRRPARDRGVPARARCRR